MEMPLLSFHISCPFTFRAILAPLTDRAVMTTTFPCSLAYDDTSVVLSSLTCHDHFMAFADARKNWWSESVSLKFLSPNEHEVDRLHQLPGRCYDGLLPSDRFPLPMIVPRYPGVRTVVEVEQHRFDEHVLDAAVPRSSVTAPFLLSRLIRHRR